MENTAEKEKSARKRRRRKKRIGDVKYEEIMTARTFHLFSRCVVKSKQGLKMQLQDRKN